MSVKKTRVTKQEDLSFVEARNQKEYNNLRAITNERFKAKGHQVLDQIKGPFLIIGLGENRQLDDRIEVEVIEFAGVGGSPKEIMYLLTEAAEMLTTVATKVTEGALEQIKQQRSK